MKRVPDEVYQLFGPPPSRWKGGREEATRKMRQFNLMKEAAYQDVYGAMGFPLAKRSGRPKLRKATKVQLVALVRVAALLYQDAQAARSIMNRWTKDAHEAIYAKNSA
jgi:hypothetical protein